MILHMHLNISYVLEKRHHKHPHNITANIQKAALQHRHNLSLPVSLLPDLILA